MGEAGVTHRAPQQRCAEEGAALCSRMRG
jgi:hypothetical protein